MSIMTGMQPQQPLAAIPTGPGLAQPIHTRLPLRLLKEDKDLWSLYLLALHTWQTDLQNWGKDPYSYFQISGIHGQPRIKWDGKAVPTKLESGSGQYCAHSIHTFPTWHRPYLQLFERTLIDNMVKGLKAVDQGHPDYMSLNTKLPAFRLPYWDWADPYAAGSYPIDIFTADEFSIPFGTSYKSVPNPFKTYQFGTNPTKGKPTGMNAAQIAYQVPSFPYWLQTARDPAGGQEDPAHAFPESRDDLVEARFRPNGGRDNLTDRIRTLFSNVSTYQAMSNDYWQARPAPPKKSSEIQDADAIALALELKEKPMQGYHSIEGAHNSVHNNIGKQGHMGDTTAAAFDPMFWLHHVNCDRLVAIWQVIYNRSLFNAPDQYAQYDTIAYDDNTLLNFRRLGLQPFVNPGTGKFYTSPECQFISNFGYTYPEIKSIPAGKTPDEVSAYMRDLMIRKYIRKNSRMAQLIPSFSKVEEPPLFIAPAQMAAPAKPAAPVAPAAPKQTLSSIVAPSFKPPKAVGELPHEMVHAPTYIDWQILIKADKYCLRGSYQIYFFLGDVPAHVKDYALWNDTVGDFAAFTSDPHAEDGCEKCRDRATHGPFLITGVVPLTGALLDRVADPKYAGAEGGQHLSLENSNIVDDTVAYLAKYLNWKVVTVAGEEVPNDDPRLEKLRIGVMSREVTKPSSPSQKATLGPSVAHLEATAGKAGGRSASHLEDDRVTGR